MSSRKFFHYVAALLSVFASNLSSRAASDAVATGSAVTLSAFADGTSPFAYQWYKDGAVLTGATAATYRIASFQGGDVGVYSTGISNSSGSIITETATLALASVPVITTQPIGATVTAGGSVTFASAASGSPAPALQWKLNGTSIAGATGASLTITNVQSVNAGTYTMVATNSAGSVTSNGATLTVNSAAFAPVINTQPVSQTVPVGSSVTFSVAASGNPSPTYRWRRNGSNISGARSATLTLTNVQSANAGTYTVTVTNNAGSVTSSGAILTVGSAAIAPVITTQPASQTVMAGANVIFSVAASGTPAPSYQWSRNGTNISGATNAALSLTNVQSANAGTYTVVATNSAGAVTSSGATLTVNAVAIAPVFTTQPAGQAVTAGATVTFSAAASGTPTPTFQWKLNGANLSGATNATLSLANVQSANAGTYTVVATNSAGAVTSNGAVLTVNAAAAPLTIGPDFNRDGNSDILWQNGVTGEWSVWLMAGTQISTGYIAGTATLDWQIRGPGDFNRDGQTDLLWQNSVTGEWRICLMTGTTVTSTVSLGQVSAIWELIGTGDFNADGNADILMHNPVTGEGGLWLMTGTSVAQKVSLGTMTTAWQMSGCGDFNRDGKSDILWHNSVTGEGRIWLMAGTTMASSVSLGTVPLAWEMSGCGDFNKDGQSDILWQNGATGECSVWLMNGTSMTSTVPLGSVTTQWTIRN